jgi:imidazoleglycerol phosphate synthase glutamine amidotransferase subunit HisH
MKLLDIPGNIGALKHWLSSFGSVELINETQLGRLNGSDILILPGGNVGGLTASLVASVRRATDRGCRLFAVCGSFQSLFLGTEEDPCHSCLQLFLGQTYKLEYPRVGLFEVDCDWFTGVPYFNHRYAVSLNEYLEGDPNTPNFAIDSTGFCVAVRTKRILGVQFHPELSMGMFDKTFKQWLDAS